jgi:erythronate-4-phosphate dehydrogenase
LDELMDCDYVALHVPLTREGEDKTWRLFDAARLERMKPGAVLVNACRGGVVDEAALRGMLDAGRFFGAILDAWEDEPAIDLETAARVLIGTPHIAGYSHDGKVNGTRMIYEAACRELGIAAEAIDVPMPAAAVERIALQCRGRRLDSVLAELILRAYPIDRDDADLRTACVREGETGVTREGAMGGAGAIGPVFDGLRKNYPLRREFAATRVSLQGTPESWPPDWPRRVADLGFAVEEPPPPGDAGALA